MDNPALKQRSGSADEDAPLWQRLLWMAGIWTMSVAALGVVGYILRLWLKS
ncbi:MAG: DUF2474 domain-containing protein [Alphaproteobacteria bacterium]|nr:DUF2474 domain-containing protein [Alphaproteobacteria bacterium]